MQSGDTDDGATLDVPARGVSTTGAAPFDEVDGMTISVNDQRLVAGKQQTREKLDALEFETEEARTICSTAKSVLTNSLDEYRAAIRREDLTDEVREILSGPRGKAADALVRVYYTLIRQHAERRARGEALTEQDKQVERFLRNLSPTEYITTSFPSAVSALEQAVDFANQTLPEDVVDLSRSALDRAREARSQIEQLGERALKAYSDLEEARETAKSNYLAVRELLSAACRIEDRYDELNEIAPPISDIMAPS